MQLTPPENARVAVTVVPEPPEPTLFTSIDEGTYTGVDAKLSVPLELATTAWRTDAAPQLVTAEP